MHCEQRLLGNPGSLAPGTQLALKNSPAAGGNDGNGHTFTDWSGHKSSKYFFTLNTEAQKY